MHRSGKDSVDHGRSGHDDYANAVCGCLRSLAFASWDSWDAAYGDGDDLPSSEPEPFEHTQAEVREYWDSLGQQIANTQGDGGHDQTHTTQTYQSTVCSQRASTPEQHSWPT